MIGIQIPSGSPKSLAQRDVERYGRLLIAKGGSDIFANGEATKLWAFAQALYELCGPCDFWDVRAAANMGSGAVLYSFKGQSGTLVNGPAWGASGIVKTVANQFIATSVAALTSYTARTFFCIADMDNTNRGRLMASSSSEPIYSIYINTSGLMLSNGNGNDTTGRFAGMSNGPGGSGDQLSLAVDHVAGNKSFACVFAPGNLKAYRQGVLVSQGSTAAGWAASLQDSGALTFLAASAEAFGPIGTAAFFADLRVSLDPARIAALHALYFSILG